MSDSFVFKRGDIVRIVETPDNPCEVYHVGALPHGDVVLFVMDKRTLNGHFKYPDQVEFVRRPVELVAANGKVLIATGSGARDVLARAGGNVRPKYGR